MRNLIIILGLILSISCFAQDGGINVSTNFGINAPLPIDARFQMENTTARDAIPASKRYEGLVVYITSNQTNYQLVGGITNSNWFLFGEVGGGSLYPDSVSNVETVVYVDHSGSDITGDGSVGSPFKTVDKAMTIVPGFSTLEAGEASAIKKFNVRLMLGEGDWDFSTEILPFISRTNTGVVMQGVSEFAFSGGTFSTDPANEMVYDNSSVDWLTTLDSNYMSYVNANTIRPIRGYTSGKIVTPFRTAPSGDIHKIKTRILFNDNFYNSLAWVTFMRCVLTVNNSNGWVEFKDWDRPQIDQCIVRGNISFNYCLAISLRNSGFYYGAGGAQMSYGVEIQNSRVSRGYSNYFVACLYDNPTGLGADGLNLWYSTGQGVWQAFMNCNGIRLVGSEWNLYAENTFINAPQSAFSFNREEPSKMSFLTAGTQIYLDTVPTIIYEDEVASEVIGRDLNFTLGIFYYRGITSTRSNTWDVGVSYPDRNILINWDNITDTEYNSLNNDNDFTIRKDVSGDAINYDAGNDILTIGSTTIIPTSTPASASATGTTGTITWDADYIYICTATDTWKRIAITTW